MYRMRIYESSSESVGVMVAERDEALMPWSFVKEILTAGGVDSYGIDGISRELGYYGSVIVSMSGRRMMVITSE